MKLLTPSNPPSPFTGKPFVRPAAKPSHAAVMRRIGVHDGVAWLLKGYVESVKGPQIFPSRYVE